MRARRSRALRPSPFAPMASLPYSVLENSLYSLVTFASGHVALMAAARGLPTMWVAIAGPRSLSVTRSAKVAIRWLMSFEWVAVAGTKYRRRAENAWPRVSTNVAATAPHVARPLPRSRFSLDAPPVSSLTPCLPRRYVSSVRWPPASLRARPVPASLEAPLNATEDGIISAVYASRRVDFPVPDPPDSMVASGWNGSVWWPSNPPQLTTCSDSSFHCVAAG